MKIQITEIIDGSNFYFQIIGEGTEKLVNLMNDIHNCNLDDEPPYAPSRNGEFVFAKYSDQKYYRSKVTKVESKNSEEPIYHVFFIDYGNSDELKKENIRFLEKERFGVKQLPPQAVTGRLAYVKAPKFETEFGPAAADLLKELVWEQELVAKYWKDRFGFCIKLGVPSKKLFVNITMVIEGYARVARSKTDDPVYKAIQEEEEKTRKSTAGMWVYGTVPDSDEEKEEEMEKKRDQKMNKKKKKPKENKEEMEKKRKQKDE